MAVFVDPLLRSAKFVCLGDWEGGNPTTSLPHLPTFFRACRTVFRACYKRSIMRVSSCRALRRIFAPRRRSRDFGGTRPGGAGLDCGFIVL